MDAAPPADEVGALCDGSSAPRLAFVRGYGFAPLTAAYFGTYGASFFVIDGACRYWVGRDDGIVFTGVLDAEAAEALAAAVRYEAAPRWESPGDDPSGCPDADLSQLWSPAGAIACRCDCTSAELTAASEMDQSLYAAADIEVTGPARLVLSPLDEVAAEPAPEPWPLPRAPSSAEIVSTSAAMDSGVLLEDEAELALFRAARMRFISRAPAARLSIPLVWTNPEDQSLVGFGMSLRDALPAPIDGVLRALLGT